MFPKRNHSMLVLSSFVLLANLADAGNSKMLANYRALSEGPARNEGDDRPGDDHLPSGVDRPGDDRPGASIVTQEDAGANSAAFSSQPQPSRVADLPTAYEPDAASVQNLLLRRGPRIPLDGNHIGNSWEAMCRGVRCYSGIDRGCVVTQEDAGDSSAALSSQHERSRVAELRAVYEPDAASVQNVLLRRCPRILRDGNHIGKRWEEMFGKKTDRPNLHLRGEATDRYRSCDDQSESGSDEPEPEFDGEQEPESEFDEPFWSSVVADLLKTYKFDASEGSWVDLQHLKTGTSPGVKEVADLPQTLTFLKKTYPDPLMGRRRDIPRPLSDSGDTEVLSMSLQQHLVHSLYRHTEIRDRKLDADEPRADYSLEEVLDHLLSPVTEVQLDYHGWVAFAEVDEPPRQAAFQRRLNKLYALRLRLLGFSHDFSNNTGTLANFDREVNTLQNKDVKQLLKNLRMEFERRWARTDDESQSNAKVMWSEKQVRTRFGREKIRTLCCRSNSYRLITRRQWSTIFFLEGLQFSCLHAM